MSISIHVPREGHDHESQQLYKHHSHISIHVPREGHDDLVLPPSNEIFISIHVPREGHDTNNAQSETGFLDFNPRAPRGARQCGGIFYYCAA